jgi:hypothetical protein
MNDNMLNYIELMIKLHVKIAGGMGDSASADAIRDKMDGPWHSMTVDQRNYVDRMSALINDIHDLHEGKPLIRAVAADDIPNVDLASLPEGDQKTPGTRLWFGVHKRHCCLEHGCKYRDEDCPVTNRKIRQDGYCETCGLERQGYFDR